MFPMSLHVFSPLIFRRFFVLFFVCSRCGEFVHNFSPKFSPIQRRFLETCPQVWDFTLVGRDERFTSPQWTEALGPVWKVLMAGKIWEIHWKYGQFVSICMFLMEKDVERIWKICGFVMEDRFKLRTMWILYVYTDIFMCIYIYTYGTSIWKHYGKHGGLFSVIGTWKISRKTDEYDL